MSGHDDLVTLLEPVMVTDPYTEEQKADWTQPPIEHPGWAANVQPAESTEAVLTAGTVISRWECFLADPAAPLVAHWRVRLDGVDYDVDGKVMLWKRHGLPHHKHCLLKLVEG